MEGGRRIDRDEAARPACGKAAAKLTRRSYGHDAGEAMRQPTPSFARKSPDTRRQGLLICDGRRLEFFLLEGRGNSHSHRSVRRTRRPPQLQHGLEHIQQQTSPYSVARSKLGSGECSLRSPAVGIIRSSGELPENLGPVGPREPILTTVGTHKRVLAFCAATGVATAALARR